jgi:glycerol-3-phosphate dehydrogenase (NAD(P)+)
MQKIAVIGGGSWATALVKILQENCNSIYWWLRDEDQIKEIDKTGRNPKYLSSCQLDTTKLIISSKINEIILNSDVIIIATPSIYINEIFLNISSEDLENKMIVNAVKGIIPQTNQLPITYFKEKYNIPKDNLAVLTGPCHAEEVAMERLSYLTIACSDKHKANKLASSISCSFIKTVSIEDTIGAELSSVLKNVYALMAGVCYGLGYGDNFLAVLISNASQELERFINQKDYIERDVKQSAYLGDLLVTAYSIHSRNRRFGLMIGKGYSIKATQLEMNMIAEGYFATKCVYEINKSLNVNCPIIKAAYHILYDKISPKIEFKILSEQIS